MVRTNELDQPIGDDVPGWSGAAFPPRKSLAGRYCRVEPLDPEKHLDDLYDAFADDVDEARWTYMAVGPFASKDAFADWLHSAGNVNDPQFHAIVDVASGMALGVAAYMRIKPDVGVIEIGSIAYSSRLQKTTVATEAMYLFMQRVFDELGYRRYEWKCDALNKASRRAALRFGFTFDGIFEQALVYKGRNRDTAWYSILDKDWPAIKADYQRWLDPANFDREGKQVQKLRVQST